MEDVTGVQTISTVNRSEDLTGNTVPETERVNIMPQREIPNNNPQSYIPDDLHRTNATSTDYAFQRWRQHFTKGSIYQNRNYLDLGDLHRSIVSSLLILNQTQNISLHLFHNVNNGNTL